MLKKILSLLLGSAKKPKPAYVFVPKQQNSKLPQKKN
jgi:hypothetical protein